jgi:hypothetical protein
MTWWCLVELCLNMCEKIVWNCLLEYLLKYKDMKVHDMVGFG